MYGIYKIYKDGKLVAEQKNKLTTLGRANALKAMLGHNQYFANSLGIGISSKPNATTTFLTDADLDFTVGKYPITSSFLGTTGAQDGLVYNARITDTSRYYITEVGLFSNVVTDAVEVDDLTIFNFEYGDPIKETPSTFNAAVTSQNPNPALFTYSNHSLYNGDIVTLTGTLPSGLSLNTNYYVINSQTNTFQLSTTFNGTGVVASGGTVTINLPNTYISDASFLNFRSATIVSDGVNYRIGKYGLKITGPSKKVFFNDTVLDMSDINNSDKFTLAAYNGASSSKNLLITFKSAGVSAIYTFNLVSGYNVVYLSKDSVSNSVDWSKIDTIEISTESSLGLTDYIILDGFRVKENKPQDAIDGLVSRSVLTEPIQKEAGSIIDIQYILSMRLDT